MQIINLNDIESIILAKADIESKLINNGKISEKMSLETFLTKYINMNNVYIKNDDVIPFDIKTINNEIYLFVINDNNLLDILLKKLESIKFDLSRLHEKTNKDITQIYIDNTVIEAFIINGKYMDV